MSVNKRGPYKQYIYEEHNPEIPASTAHSRKKRHDHSQENLGSVENIKCSKLSRIEEINVAGSSNEVAIIPIVSSEKDSGSEGLQSSDGEVDDISSCLSHDEGDDSLLCTDNLKLIWPLTWKNMRKSLLLMKITIMLLIMPKIIIKIHTWSSFAKYCTKDAIFQKKKAKCCL
ncbi:uncharacterized protein [Temnothorax longispinosus]|uniref:uncharacterized protein n=1 Tax=Temnothorax longispinosus TaxID=300112 RepID=UPI003A9A5071